MRPADGVGWAYEVIRDNGQGELDVYEGDAEEQDGEGDGGGESGEEGDGDGEEEEEGEDQALAGNEQCHFTSPSGSS